MTFSLSVKSELCKVSVSKRCCKMSEAYGFLLYGHSFSCDGISLLTENAETAAHYATLTDSLFHVRPEFCAHGADFSSRFLLLRIPSRKDCERILQSFGHLVPEAPLAVNRRVFDRSCCIGAFLRGVFLACGTVSNPKKEYHLEFSTPHRRLSDDLACILAENGFAPKQMERRKSFVVYLKSSEQIEDFLTFIKATNSSLELMNDKILKDIRNKSNRITNCETANITKTVNAALRQAEAVRLILENGGIGQLDDELQETALLRLENPDMSLSELCGRLSEPLSRSGLNHRLRRILQKAEEIEKELKKES